MFFDLVTRLRDEFPGLQAAIAGIGIDFEEMQAELRQSGRDRFIHLLGRRSDMPALFQAADLMLHVSAAEGVPNAVMEAQWLGCPVVGTLSGGTGEILTEPQRPYFHAIDDEEGLYRSCRGLLADTPLRQRLGQSSRAEARRRFCADTLVERTVDLARATAPFTLPSPRVRGFRPATILAFMRLWLRLARPVHHLRRWVRRRRYSAVVTDISAELGHCYLAPIPAQLTSDDCGTSALRLREDGRLLSPAHTLHTDIRSLGGGRYSHWGASLYFSTSDNSDPRDNGRVYTVEEADTHVDDTALV
ncbi:MAG: glycosyltransferase family 4 protein [Magnetospirillum sp.]|nr:glycosyltransferase family 4 protein [Magnetospirillum sp.]